MRLKRLELQGVRNFQETTVIDFVDPRLGTPLDLAVMVGSNGCGKTTVMEVIEALLQLAIEKRASPLLRGVRLAALTVELAAVDSVALPVGDPRAELTMAVGDADLLDARCEGWAEHAVVKVPSGPGAAGGFSGTSLATEYRHHAHRVAAGVAPLVGGLLRFPEDRGLGAVRGGTIEPPASQPQLLFNYRASDQWHESLEHVWVWLNYLDLERKVEREESGADVFPELPRALDLLLTVLGEDRRIQVREGRVRVTTAGTAGPDGVSWVSLDQLPSGERQCVILFGELALQRRPGAVVLIDEPEISLHPALQRQVVAALRRFARDYDAQVILATHSEEIVGCVAPEQVIDLDFPGYRFQRPEPAEAQS